MTTAILKLPNRVDLADFERQINRIDGLVDELFDQIERAKREGATFTDLEDSTGISRGALQDICKGKRPRVF